MNVTSLVGIGDIFEVSHGQGGEIDRVRNAIALSGDDWRIGDIWLEGHGQSFGEQNQFNYPFGIRVFIVAGVDDTFEVIHERGNGIGNLCRNNSGCECGRFRGCCYWWMWWRFQELCFGCFRRERTIRWASWNGGNVLKGTHGVLSRKSKFYIDHCTFSIGSISLRRGWSI